MLSQNMDLWMYHKKKHFSKMNKAQPTKHQPGGYFEGIQKDFLIRQSLGGPLAISTLTIFSL